MDEAFLRARGILSGKRLRLVFFSMVPGAFLAVLLWVTAHGWTLGTVPAGSGRMQAFTVLRAVAIAAQSTIGCWVAWWMYDRVRGPLPRTSARTLPWRALIFAPIVTAWLLVPHVFVMGDALSAGDTAWLPGAWIDAVHTGLFAVVFALGILVWPLVQYAPIVIAVEGTGPLGALWRSISLSWHSGGQCLGVAFTFLLLHVLLGGALAAALAFLFGDTITILRGGDPTASDALYLSSGMVLVEALLAPHRTCAYLFSYLSICVRRDGLDVVRAAHAAGLITERPAS